MKKKGRGKKPNAPKPKNTKQKQKQQQNVNVKIHIDNSKKTRANKGSNNPRVIHHQPISSFPLFREEAPQPPPFRNLNEPPQELLYKVGKIPETPNTVFRKPKVYIPTTTPTPRKQPNILSAKETPLKTPRDDNIGSIDEFYHYAPTFFGGSQPPLRTPSPIQSRKPRRTQDQMTDEDRRIATARRERAREIADLKIAGKWNYTTKRPSK